MAYPTFLYSTPRRLHLTQPSQIANTKIVNGIVVTNNIHHLTDTCSPSSLYSKNFVLKMAEIKVPGKKNMVTAAIVIMDAESRCV